MKPIPMTTSISGSKKQKRFLMRIAALLVWEGIYYGFQTFDLDMQLPNSALRIFWGLFLDDIASPTRYEILRNVFLHLPSHKINGWDDVCLWRETDLLQFMRALCETNSSNYAQNIGIMNILNWANLCARCVSHHLLTSDWLSVIYKEISSL